MFRFGDPAPPRAPAVALPWLPWLHKQLNGTLDPWIEALSEGARFAFYSGEFGSPVRIQIRTNGAIDVRVFEAIELLALVSGVDARLFSHLVEAAARTHSRIRRPPCGATPIECSLAITYDDNDPNAITNWCERLVVDGIEDTASEEYLRVRTLLESAYEMVDAATPPDVARVPRDALLVRVEVEAYRGDLEDFIAPLAQVGWTQQARDSPEERGLHRHTWKPIFRVTEVNPGYRQPISARAFLYMTELARCGICVRFCREFDIDVEASSAAIFTRGLQLLLSTPTNNDDENTMTTALKNVQLPLFMTERTISAVFSALMVNRSVKFLTINNTPLPWLVNPNGNREMTRSERDHLWKWVAFALFSRYATHRIKNVSFHVQNLDRADVAAFRAALHRPEDTIKPLPSGHSDDDTPLEPVSASRFVLTPPLASHPVEFQRDVAFATQDVLVAGKETAPQSADWLRVILPGCGHAWVHHTWATPSMSNAPRPPAHVSSISIAYMSDQSKLAALELLQLVGANVKKLHVANCSTRDPLDAWFRSVVQACPRLERLSIVNCPRLTSMNVFGEMYTDGACRVRSLSVEGVCFDNTDSIAAFLRLLGDNTVRMSKQLHKLTLSARHVEAPLDDLLHVMDATLSSNTALQKLDVSLKYAPGVPVLDYEAAIPLYRRHRGKPVAVQKGPFPLAAKHAFCSVLTAAEHRTIGSSDQGAALPESTSTLPTVVPHLDHRVLTLIFEYAANTKKRDVSVSFSTERNDEPEDDDEIHDDEADDAMDEA